MQTMDQLITYNYNYHITITTSQGTFVHTNIYSPSATNPPIITVLKLRFSNKRIKRL